MVRYLARPPYDFDTSPQTGTRDPATLVAEAVADHLLDHLAEMERRLAERPTIPDQWHGLMATADADRLRTLHRDRPGRGDPATCA
jgi:hypothetical protein